MTLPERNTRRHDADEAPRANPCARDIDRNNRKRTVGGSTGQGRVRGVGRTMGDSTDLVDCAGRRGDIGRVGRSRLHSEYRCKRVRGTRSEGAAHSRDGELKLPALFDGGMSLRGCMRILYHSGAWDVTEKKTGRRKRRGGRFVLAPRVRARPIAIRTTWTLIHKGLLCFYASPDHTHRHAKQRKRACDVMVQI